jgi:hypothetical protein
MQILEAVVGGVAVAITWALLLFITNLIRNLVFERRLRRAFSIVGFSCSTNALGLVFRNDTDIPVKVWGAAFSCSGGGYMPLVYCGEKVAHRRMRLSGFWRPRWLFLDFPPYLSDMKEGAVTLDFDMSAIWEIDRARVGKWDTPPEGAYCLLEYTTLLQTRKRIFVRVSNVKAMQEFFGRFCRKRG